MVLNDKQTTDHSEAIKILTALANGIHPLTGEVFPADSAYQTVEVVGALYAAIRALESRPRGSRSRSRLPPNAGMPWTEEEDSKLLAHFGRGSSVADIAQSHERTPAGIQARLERLGKIPVR